MRKLFHKFLKLCHQTPIIKYLYEIWLRVNTAKTYDKLSFKNTGKVFDNIYADNYWNSAESRSGGGSELISTQIIRKQLPILWKKLNIKTLLDAPCGDYNWMNTVEKSGIDYIGGDIVEDAIKRNNIEFGSKNVSFQTLDITKDAIPKVDMIFCKDCLQHLSYDSVINALKNFKNSGSTYLMATSYPLTFINYDILDGDYRPLNLMKAPFSLKNNYLFRVWERSPGVEMDKVMYIWKLSDIDL